MQTYSTVTQKGQVTIPKAIRDSVGIMLYGRVDVFTEGDRVVLMPQKTILDLAPIAIAQRGKTALKAREYMSKNYKPR